MQSQYFSYLPTESTSFDVSLLNISKPEQFSPNPVKNPISDLPKKKKKRKKKIGLSSSQLFTDYLFC